MAKQQLMSAGTGMALGGLAGGAALLLVLVGPVFTFAGLIALGIGLLALTSLEFALVVLLATVALLPFGAMPVKIALTPSLIDATLGLFLLVYLFQWMTGRRTELRTTPVHLVIGVFILVLLGAFIMGMPNAPLTPGTLRRFVGLIGNILLAFVIVDVVRTRAMLRHIAAWWIVVGAAAAVIGIGLWFLNDFTAESILNRLGRIGYPVGGVIRYREDGVSVLNERAIGTWIDPNAYGGFLMMVGAFAAPQLLAKRPVLQYRWTAYPFLGAIGLALFLSDSRGSMLGLAAGIGLVALLRYRRLIGLMAVVGVLVLLLPQTQGFIGRLIAGLSGADLETQMRFGEYQDALRLIARYPVLGVGFSAPPDIDLYLGVASTYLTIATNAGVVGLVAYFAALGSTFGFGYVQREAVVMDDGINDIWFGLLGGIVGAMFSSIFDHFYFNIEYQATSLIFWLYVGLFLAAISIANPPDPAKELGMPKVPHFERVERPQGVVQQPESMSAVGD
ncbi:MAG: O-antigen ligase family protein [Anaerolineales bacterium]|nr:O-antigen ligase family protein [Anaerolineales bacterium]